MSAKTATTQRGTEGEFNAKRAESIERVRNVPVPGMAAQIG
jgi:hypothetical protein